jgi:IclR family transcriptional regulator, acetate operon repressor
MTERRPGVSASSGGVQSVDRALRIVEMLAEPMNQQQGLGLAEIAARAGVAKSSAHALLATLMSHGYVARTEPGPRFRLGMSLMRLGEMVAGNMPLVDVARPVLRSLAAAASMTARLVLSDNGRPLYVARVEGPGSVQFTSQVGQYERPHSTGSGKVILASLSDDEALRVVAESGGLVRRTRNTFVEEPALVAELARIRGRGFAVDDEEDADGVVCVAAGVRDRFGSCLGAISCSGLRVSVGPGRVEELGSLVREHADQLSSRLGAATPA